MPLNLELVHENKILMPVYSAIKPSSWAEFVITIINFKYLFLLFPSRSHYAPSMAAIHHNRDA